MPMIEVHYKLRQTDDQGMITRQCVESEMTTPLADSLTTRSNIIKRVSDRHGARNVSVTGVNCISVVRKVV